MQNKGSVRQADARHFERVIEMCENCIKAWRCPERSRGIACTDYEGGAYETEEKPPTQ